MEIVIKGEAKEIADLVHEIQNRQIESAFKPVLDSVSKSLSEPLRWG